MIVAEPVVLDELPLSLWNCQEKNCLFKSNCNLSLLWNTYRLNLVLFWCRTDSKRVLVLFTYRSIRYWKSVNSTLHTSHDQQIIITWKCHHWRTKFPLLLITYIDPSLIVQMNPIEHEKESWGSTLECHQLTLISRKSYFVYVLCQTGNSVFFIIRWNTCTSKNNKKSQQYPYILMQLHCLI